VNVRAALAKSHWPDMPNTVMLAMRLYGLSVRVAGSGFLTFLGRIFSGNAKKTVATMTHHLGSRPSFAKWERATSRREQAVSRAKNGRNTRGVPSRYSRKKPYLYRWIYADSNDGKGFFELRDSEQRRAA
jgi:hypothetical protein